MSAIPLFSLEGIAQLSSFCCKFPVIALDFDGTLVALARTPLEVSCSQETAQALASISKYTEVWIVTGRKAQDIEKILPVTVDHIIGNHGLESSFSDSGFLESARKINRDWLRQIFSKDIQDRHNYIFSSFAHSIGVWVEDKEFSLSLHYRNSSSEEDASAAIKSLAELLQPRPQMIKGAKVFNLLPPGSPGKGLAIESLLSLTGHSSAIFFGDDVTDEAAFSLSSERLFGIRVGCSLETKSSYFIEKQDDIIKALQIIQTILSAMGMRRC